MGFVEELYDRGLLSIETVYKSWAAEDPGSIVAGIAAGTLAVGAGILAYCLFGWEIVPFFLIAGGSWYLMYGLVGGWSAKKKYVRLFTRDGMYDVPADMFDAVLVERLSRLCPPSTD